MKWKHNELAHDLAQHLQNSTDRVVWEDMQLGPAGSPRPDVYTIPKSYTKFCPIAYECKISVSDFRSDITKGKWSSYLKYSSGVIFAVPKGLITKDDVSKGCGLIVRSENVWRMVKGPTLLPLQDLPREAWLKLVIDGVDRSIREYNTNRFYQNDVHDKIAKEYGEQLAIALANRDTAQRHLEQKTDNLKQKNKELDLVRAIEDAREEKEYLLKLRTELCEQLGLKPNSHQYAIQTALRNKLNLLNSDENYLRSQHVVGNLLRDMEQQVKSLKEVAAPLFEIKQGDLA
ncbi:hypothetical protein GCM10023206_07270 [Acinetobacter puyangensis]|uniref:MmcB family DNA repair protein n=1 Tax=Acinetobacter puyangensis TaxID=1096779 RepID=A0A240E7H4_9GAMM|nr:MmcB family DNA repair protein [Acinetobacter puyangensis]SNX44193.1 Protein of unknown function [Acinetobacter puyangensis]